MFLVCSICDAVQPQKGTYGRAFQMDGVIEWRNWVHTVKIVTVVSKGYYLGVRLARIGTLLSQYAPTHGATSSVGLLLFSN